MKRLWQSVIGVCAFGALLVTTGYFIDQHRCKRINYEQVGYELPKTWLISAGQCMEAANTIRLRGYARNV